LIKAFNGKKPKIAKSALVSEAACIIGDVEIGENASVWPGAVIRGDFGKITIGKGAVVEDNSVIHSGSPQSIIRDVIIGDEVHIGHGAVVNCHKVGNHVLIGMNATLLHDAEIGNSCIIGANCLVSQGMKVPDNSFVVGVPGKIKGRVSPKQSFWVTEAPKNYIKLVKRYKEQGGI
jgi:carbonic anhydrase/acetyltransferase-like protein (isoleucine patch superfamily)